MVRGCSCWKCHCCCVVTSKSARGCSSSGEGNRHWSGFSGSGQVDGIAQLVVLAHCWSRQLLNPRILSSTQLDDHIYLLRGFLASGFFSLPCTSHTILYPSTGRKHRAKVEEYMLDLTSSLIRQAKIAQTNLIVAALLFGHISHFSCNDSWTLQGPQPWLHWNH